MKVKQKMKREIMENENGGINIRKKLKRKINEHCEAPIDTKIVKLEQENEKIIVNSMDNNDEMNSSEIKLETIKMEQENDDEISDNNNESNEINTNNKLSLNNPINRITGKYIRKILNGAGGIGILRKFIAICNNKANNEDNYDLAGEYLEAKGSVLEILQLLDKLDKKNLSNVAIIFSTMQILILKIISQYPQYLINTEQACRYFINSHLSSVYLMLSSQSIAQNRKICLRLLTTIVTLGGNLPRELLGHLSFNTQTLQLLCQHTKPNDLNNVRTCFIHFIISLLINGSINVIRELLNKRGMITSIFSGLIYDKSTIVHLVLDTVKNNILENNYISKTTKLYLFSTPVVQNLVNLYNWKGPLQWTGNNLKKLKPITQLIDPNDKQIAIEAVHKFLLLLLTSTRYGIIFNDKTLGTSGRNYNQLANSILSCLDKPWEYEKPRELVQKILSSTPDLIKSQLIYMEVFMVPKLSLKWIELMKFIRSIIIDINYDTILISNINELTFSQFISATLTFSVPKIVIKNAITPAINNSNIILRYVAIVTLTNMLEQVGKIFKLMKNNNCHYDNDEFGQFKITICDYIVKNSPCLMDLLRELEQNLIDNNNEEELDENLIEKIDKPSNFEYFSSIINLFEIYRDICPEYFMEFNVNNGENTEPIYLLKGLKIIEDKYDGNGEKFDEIKVKVIEFILSIYPDTFITNKEYFGDCLIFLISLLNNKQLEINLNAMKVIKRILISSQTFEGHENQIDIWINCFKLLNDCDKLFEVSKWFVKLLQRAIKRTDDYLNRIIKAEEEIIIDNEEMDKNQTENIINELFVRVQTRLDRKIIIMQPTQSIPLLFCAAIDSLEKKTNENVANYLSFVATLTLHCQINPGTMTKLTENIETLPNKYLSSWNTKNGINMKKPFNNNDLLRKYSKILLTNEIIDWKNVFLGDKKLEINYNSELIKINYSLDNYDIISLLNMTLFYLTQSLRQMQMNNEQFERYKMSIIILLNIAINCDSENKLTEQCLELIFTNPILLKYFTPLSTETDKNPLKLIITNELIYKIIKLIIGKNDDNYYSFNEIFNPFKQKYLLQLNLLINKSINGWRINETINLNKFIELFQFNSTELFNILNEIFKLSNKMILSLDKNNLSLWGEIIPKLMELILKNDNVTIENNLIMLKKLFKHLSQLLIKSNVNIDNWFVALNKYLTKYSHNISLIDEKLFKLILQSELTMSTINLIGLITNRNNKLIPIFVEHIVKIDVTLIKNRELIFTIISSNLNYKWNNEMLKNIFQHNINDIANYFTFQTNNNNNWIESNINSIIYLINSTFNSEICERIIDKILSSGDKFNEININYIKLLRCLIQTNTKLNKNDKTIDAIINFIQILIRIGVGALKKYSSNNNECLKYICSYICEAIDNIKLLNNNIQIDSVNKNNSWRQFSRFSLKIGLKIANENVKKTSPEILKTLAKICSIVYKDNSDNDYIKIIFDMTTTHSQFINIILGNDMIKKYELFELIFVLVRKNYSIMLKKHIPLYLSAYNATLNKCDQIILMILQHYERQKIKLNDYKPYFWGESAANYYSVKAETDTALWRQPSTTQIFDLFNIDKVTKTIENYPTKRNLYPQEYINNNNNIQDVYDPAFYLPLFSYLMADNNIVNCNRVTQNGGLSLVFAACGSECDDVKMAAFTVLSQFYFHLEGTSHKERLLWMRIIDGLRNGLLLTTIKEIKISCLISTFLAKSSLITTQPLNPLYSRIQLFFMAKQALDLNTIPELLILFNSSEINHQINRYWILEIIRDGIKSDIDIDLSLKCLLFRMLFDFYHCILSDQRTKHLILEIVNVSVKIPKAKLLLIRNYSLVVWLNTVVKNIEQQQQQQQQYDNTMVIKLIMNIIKNLMINIMKTNEREHNEFMMLIVVKNITKKLTKTIDIDTFNNYLTTLNDLSSVKLFKKIIQKNDIEYLINLSCKITVINIDECIDMFNNGCQYINHDELINNNNNNQDNTEFNFIEFNLKKLIINWHNSQLIEIM